MTPSNLIIRREAERDRSGVHTVNALAFEREDEANLVDVLREQADPYLSLVAEEDGRIVGHILFTPVVITGHSDCQLMGLGPMAVLPERQRAGIGSQLVTSGLAACKELGYGAVVVLGHPWFYPKYGFAPASRHGIDCEYDVSDDVFMAVELIPGYLRSVSGTVVYHDAFRQL